MVKSITDLTLQWPRNFHHRWCPRGGGSMEPRKKTTFPEEFINYLDTDDNHIPAKIKK